MSATGRRPRAKDDDRGKAGRIDALAEVLADRQCPPARRKLAAVALGKAADRRALAPLIDAIGDSPEVAAAAVDALAEIGDPKAVGPLVAALGHSRHFSVKEGVIDALGKIGDPGAIDPLIAKLQDRSEDFYIRKKAARTLYVIYKKGHLDEEQKEKVLSHWHSWYLL